MADRELQSHKKSDKIKWIITAIAFVLIFAILVGMCVHLSLLGKGSDNAPKAVTETRTLTFDDLDKRTSISEVEQVWEENGIVFTNFKGDGISINEEYYNPIRLYKRSMVVVECEEMIDIVFYCSNSTYMDNLKSSFENVSGITVKEIESNVMVFFDKPADSFAIYDLAGIVYLKQVAVTVIVSFSEEQIEDEASGGLILPAVSGSNGIRLMSTVIPVELYGEYDIQPYVESAYTLTATISPAESDVKDFTWSAKFKNPSSSWATGKNVDSYVGLAVNTSDSLKCTVTCKQAFGEPIEISITYVYNESITSSVQVNYIKRVESVTVTGYDTSKFNSGEAQTLSLTPTYGVGTVQGTITYGNSWGEFDTGFYNHITGPYYTGQAPKYYQLAEQTSETGDHSLDFRHTSQYTGPSTNLSLDLIVDSFLGDPDVNGVLYLVAALHAAVDEYGYNSHLRVCVAYTYTYSTYFTSTGTAYSEYGAISQRYLENPYTGISQVQIVGGNKYYF